MHNIETWYNKNRNVIIHLYYELIDISKKNGIDIKDNKQTYNNFIKMMYNESSKEIIDKNLHSEFFYKKYNSKGYEKYEILN